MFKRDDAVGDAMKLRVRPIGSAVVEEENGGLPANKKLFGFGLGKSFRNELHGYR